MGSHQAVENTWDIEMGLDKLYFLPDDFDMN
jgi:hypothetical protein